jgi:hypothetical protein
MYLASESRELLLGGDRLGAVQLALAALPSDGSDRPVTSEAEFALTEALGSYTTPGLLTTSPVWKYGTGTSIKKFRVDSDNYRIAILDAQGDMMVWDAVSHTLLGSFKEDGHNLNDFIFGENGGCMTLVEFLFGYGWFSPGYILACLLLWAYVYWRAGGRKGK